MDNHFILSPVSEDDIQAASELLCQSKLALSINRLLWEHWPNHAAQRVVYGGQIEGAFKDAAQECYKVTEGQDLIAFVVLSKEAAVVQYPAAEEEPSSSTPAGQIKEVRELVLRTVDQLTSDMQTKDRYELVYLAVRSEYRRKGIGSALLEQCFGKAKEAGLPLYVCSEPAAVPFFLAKGFKEIGHAEIDLAKLAAPYSGYGHFRLTTLVWRSS